MSINYEVLCQYNPSSCSPSAGIEVILFIFLAIAIFLIIPYAFIKLEEDYKRLNPPKEQCKQDKNYWLNEWKKMKARDVSGEGDSYSTRESRLLAFYDNLFNAFDSLMNKARSHASSCTVAPILEPMDEYSSICR